MSQRDSKWEIYKPLICKWIMAHTAHTGQYNTLFILPATCASKNWLIDWIIDLMTDWLIDWVINFGKTDWKIDWLIEEMTAQLID